MLFGLEEVPFHFTGIPAVLLVHAYTLYVFFYLFTRAACRRLDRSALEAARSLGASGASTLFRVVLPQLAPAIGGAALLVFMTSMASFSAPFIFATSERILSLEVFHSHDRGDLAKSLAQTTVLTLTSLAALALFRGAGGGRAALEGHGLAPKRLARRGPIVTAAAALAAGLVALVLLLPHATIVLLAFAKNGTWTNTVLPPKYTLENFSAFVTAVVRLFESGGPSPLLAPIGHSLWMTALSTAANVVFGVLAAILLVRVRPRGGRLVEGAILLAWALPGTAVAINLLTAFPGLTGTVKILPLAYVVRNLPVLVRSASTSLAQVPPSLEEAARGLGAGRVVALRRVLLPLVAPGILAGALLVFVTTLGEFVATILLHAAQRDDLDPDRRRLPGVQLRLGRRVRSGAARPHRPRARRVAEVLRQRRRPRRGLRGGLQSPRRRRARAPDSGNGESVSWPPRSRVPPSSSSSPPSRRARSPSPSRPRRREGPPSRSPRRTRNPTSPRRPRTRPTSRRRRSSRSRVPRTRRADYYADEDSPEARLVPAYKSRCVTFFHDIAGKKELAEVSVTAIDKKETEPEKFLSLYKGNLEDHFADTLVFEVNDKAKFKGKKATGFKIEGKIKGESGSVLVLESWIFEHKDFIMVYEVAADGPATVDKLEKDLRGISRSP